MAATIGGKVKLDGEAEYRSALKNINSEVKTLQSEMKAASSSFDENASAEEKAQKSADLLAKAMEEQQKKIDLVQQRLDAANKVYGEGSTETQKYRKELADSQTTMGKMKDEAQKLESGVKDVADAEEDATGKTSTFGDTLKANLTADAITNGLSAIKDGIENIASSSVDAWHSVDDGMDTITTKTGATGDALEDMQQRAKDIATSIPTDFETAGTAIGEVNTRFGVTGDTLSDLSTKFIQFAEINGTDVNSSIDSVQTALSAFGLSANDAGAMLDALNVAGQNSGISLDKLESELTSNATAFQSMGFSAQDSINLLSTLEKSGVDTSTVITGLSKVQQKAAKEGVSMQDEFTKAVGSSQDAIDIFGSKAGPKLYEAFQNGTLSVEDFTAANASLDDSLGSVSDTYEATLDPLDQVTVAQNKLQELQADLVDAIMPALLPLIEQAGDYISQIDLTAIADKIASIDFEGLISHLADVGDKVMSVANFLMDNSDAVVAVLAGVGTAIAALKFGDVLSSLSAVVPALGGVVTAMGPVGLALGAVVTAGVLVYQNWDTIKEKAGELKEAVGEKINDIKENISEKWDNVKEKTSEIWGNVKETVSEKWDDVKSKTSEVVDNIKGAVSEKWDDIKSKTSEVYGDIKDTVTEKWDETKKNTKDKLDDIKKAYDDHGGGMKGAVAAAGEAIKGNYQTTYNTLNTLTKGKFGEMLSTAKDKMSSMESDISDKLSNIKSGFKTKLSDISSNLKEKFTTMKNNAKEKMQDMKQNIADKLGNIKSDFSEKLGNAADTAKDKLSSIRDSARDKINDARDLIKGGLDKISGFFSGLDWKLPSIKLPHFSISGELSINPPSVPHLSVDWYAKAMQDGMILNSPTIFGAANGKLLGAGERGPEVVVGASSLEQMIGKAVAQSNNSVTINVYGQEGQDVNQLAQIVSDKINAAVMRQQRAFA